MRLRSRPTPRPGADWVQPRAAGSSTMVGSLDGVTALVDQAGLVALAGRRWSLDWWIGAEDRWHVPAREPAVRQALLGSSPVVETRLRVPSGDAVQRTYAARGPGGGDVLVVEVHNDSKVPFAVALALRPYGLDGEGALTSIELDGTTVRVDGEVALVLPRSPGRATLSAGADGDAAATVFSGDAAPVRAGVVRCADDLATGALLFPLAHTATLRVVLPLDSAEVAPDELPGADQVASGWAVQSQRGTRFEVPDRRLREASAASGRYLLLGPSDPRLAAALDLMGFADEAASALLEDPVAAAGTGTPGGLLHALAWHWHLTRDVEAARASAALVAALLPRLGRSSGEADRVLGHAALPLVADLLDAAGERRAAADVRALVRPAPAPALAPPDPLSRLGSASATWTWPEGSRGHDRTANAALLCDLRRLLVQEVPGGLALTPVVPEAWLGQGWEVHDAPTGHGRLGYAIRWHGDRPALLWELDPHPGGPPTRLTVPAFDPAWSSTEPRGEALLAAVPVPKRPSGRRGLTLPVTIEPMPRSQR